MCEIVLRRRRRRRRAICRADNAKRETGGERGRKREREHFPAKVENALKRNHFRRVQDAAPPGYLATPIPSLNGLTSLTAAISGWKNENNGITIIAWATLVLRRRFLLCGAGARCKCSSEHDELAEAVDEAMTTLIWR